MLILLIYFSHGRINYVVFFAGVSAKHRTSRRLEFYFHGRKKKHVWTDCAGKRMLVLGN